MKKKTQILMIHGGMTFRNRKDYLSYLKNRFIYITKQKRWSGSYMDEKLGNEFSIIRPEMPQKLDAKYEDWKINFERYFTYLNNNLILIGNSLGSIFLAKYLSENKFPKKILSVYLVCPPFDDTCIDEDLVGGFKLKKDLSLMETNCEDITLMFSKDDDCVPVDHAEKYRAKLKKSKIIIYKSKNGHFNVPTFPEIVKMVKEDLKKLK